MAKRGLIERGLPPEVVDALPVAQVVMLYTMQTYEDLRDDLHKWFCVSYPEARDGMEAAQDQLGRSKEKREILPVADQLLPAVQMCREWIVQTDREIAALRVIEALRMYGAAHKGRLPKKLSDVGDINIAM